MQGLFSKFKQLHLVSSQNRLVSELTDILIEDNWSVRALAVCKSSKTSSYKMLVDPAKVEHIDFLDNTAHAKCDEAELFDSPTLDQDQWRDELQSRRCWSAADLCGYRIRSRNGWAGNMRDLVVDVSVWKIIYGVADTRSWLPNDSSMFPTNRINSVCSGTGKISVELSQEPLVPALNDASLRSENPIPLR